MVGIWVETAVLLFAFLVIMPSIAVAVGYAAWKGKPKSFDRAMYWTTFVAAIAISALLLVGSQRMHADVRGWRYIVQLALFAVGVLFMGIAGGCMVGIFANRSALPRRRHN